MGEVAARTLEGVRAPVGVLPGVITLGVNCPGPGEVPKAPMSPITGVGWFMKPVSGAGVCGA